MNQTLTTEEIIQFVTLKELTPESIRFIAKVNYLINNDKDLRRRVAAMETLYDSLTCPPAEIRQALLALDEKNLEKQNLSFN